MARAFVNAQVLIVLVCDVLFSGVIYGWAPLALILQEEGQYQELCKNSTTRCSKQDTQLNLIYSVAAFLSAMISFPVGILLDQIGTKTTMLCAGLLQTSGFLLLGLADSKTFDVLVIAYSVLAVGGGMTLMGSFASSFLIPRYQTAILAGVSCAFDGSSVVMLGLYSIHETFELTRRTIFIVYAMLCFALYGSLVFLWHINEKLLDVDHNTSGEEEPLLPIKSVEKKDKKVTSRQATLKKHILSYEFIYLLFFTSIHLFRSNFYIGTTNSVLEIYGDAKHNYFYTKVFGFILPLGFVFVPSINYVVEVLGMPFAMYFTSFLGLLYNSLALISILPVQIISFITFTGFRAYLYTVVTAFAAKVFGLQYMGTLVGAIYTTGSIFSLLQIPAVAYANNLRDYNAVYIGTLGLSVILLPLTEYFRQRSKYSR
ncbi:hypothetical protein THRCLA_21176 [Thraustotheca clavata]|uniref:Major Facilitator Superfamily (MFS) n=1 Tax=Thraustotheca clavata TaxID=74557 RepID=A0A1V9ZZH2_9STRA|nr:hypothetical protein THRCLA_21176 [Thraustotheca clavata]